MYVHYYFVRRRASVPLQCAVFTFKFVSINSVSSWRYLSTLALVWKLILLSLGCMFLLCSASKICSFCLLFWCSNVMFSVRIFHNSVVGHGCFFKCCAMELVSESTWEINNYGRYINQFPSNIIKSIRHYERINKKICRQKLSIMFNEICINEEML